MRFLSSSKEKGNGSILKLAGRLIAFSHQCTLEPLTGKCTTCKKRKLHCKYNPVPTKSASPSSSSPSSASSRLASSTPASTPPVEEKAASNNIPPKSNDPNHPTYEGQQHKTTRSFSGFPSQPHSNTFGSSHSQDPNQNSQLSGSSPFTPILHPRAFHRQRSHYPTGDDKPTIHSFGTTSSPIRGQHNTALQTDYQFELPQNILPLDPKLTRCICEPNAEFRCGYCST